ncbi:VanW family protein [Mechercharimyces sp. CAU 1602]|uniref:VanW family protein n=1 Tax=Mechercharimyces sp. CAU 1602 TaxID=2973933 RepID=UPI002161F504|nr:VanW family protein [Mechercharimyces sp. CAU 1602]MCS1350559.1 VanW family protein [Mechercharimyces sp. CAU 1602]
MRMKMYIGVFMTCVVMLLSVSSSMSVHVPSSVVSLLQEEGTTELVMEWKGQRWKLDLAQIGYDGIDPMSIDRRAFYEWLRVLELQVNRLPQNAYFRDHKIKPHRNGIQIDRNQIDDWLEMIHLYLHQPQPLPIIQIPPAITTETLRKIKGKKLGSYMTRFNPSNQNRAHNIMLSVEALDHRVVDVGEYFSFNEVVGERTVERGYRQAPVIVRGEYSEGIGGGICQTSSTLFNAVDGAGLRIVQRVSHSKEVTYVPVKRDATVSWGGPDFQFQNQLNRPVLIVAKVSHGWLTIMVYGTEEIAHQTREVPRAPEKEPRTQPAPARVD